MSKDYRYFIGIGLPEKEDEVISAAKKSLHPQNRLTSPAHITLIPPFYFNNESALIQQLSKWAKQQEKFWVHLERVGSFRHKNYATVWLAPDKGEEIKKLYKSLAEKYPDTIRKGWEFIPHMTLAQKVEKEHLRLTKNQVRDMAIELDLEVKSVWLFRKAENESSWSKYLEFEFE